jgi:hypothetical protein
MKCAATSELTTAGSYKAKHTIAQDSTSVLLGIYPREMDT